MPNVPSAFLIPDNQRFVADGLQITFFQIVGVHGGAPTGGLPAAGAMVSKITMRVRFGKKRTDLTDPVFGQAVQVVDCFGPEETVFEDTTIEEIARSLTISVQEGKITEEQMTAMMLTIGNIAGLLFSEDVMGFVGAYLAARNVILIPPVRRA